jgi:hypothetical protein
MAYQTPNTSREVSDGLTAGYNRIEGNQSVLRNMITLSSITQYLTDIGGSPITIYSAPVTLADGERLRLVTIRYYIEPVSVTAARFKVQYGSSTAWESAGREGQESPSQILHTASGGTTDDLKVIIENTAGTSQVASFQASLEVY